MGGAEFYPASFRDPCSRSPVLAAMKKRSRSFYSLPRGLAQGLLLSLLLQPNWNSHPGKRGVLPSKSRQVVLFTPCHIMSINREDLKILIRCKDPGPREPTVALFPSIGAQGLGHSRNGLFILKRAAYRTDSSALVATLYRGLVRQCLVYGNVVLELCPWPAISDIWLGIRTVPGLSVAKESRGASQITHWPRSARTQAGRCGLTDRQSSGKKLLSFVRLLICPSLLEEFTGHGMPVECSKLTCFAKVKNRHGSPAVRSTIAVGRCQSSFAYCEAEFDLEKGKNRSKATYSH